MAFSYFYVFIGHIIYQRNQNHKIPATANRFEFPNQNSQTLNNELHPKDHNLLTKQKLGLLSKPNSPEILPRITAHPSPSNKAMQNNAKTQKRLQSCGALSSANDDYYFSDVSFRGKRPTSRGSTKNTKKKTQN